MRTGDILKLSLRIFKTNKMRTLLTVLGIGVGIGAILFLVSLGYGLQKVIMDKIASSDALLAIDIISGSSKELMLDQELIDKIETLESVAEVSPLVNYNSLIEINSFSGGSSVEFVKESFFRLAGMNLGDDEIFQDEELKKIVISTAILKLFNLDSDISKIPGDVKITVINSKMKNDNSNESTESEVELVDMGGDFKIVGVINDDSTPLVYMNIRNIEDFEVREYNQLKVKANSEKEVAVLRDIVYDMGYGVSSISETIDQANKIFTIIRIILGIFGIIALSVSAIGMFNTMTISLLQRTKEIGVMKAIGAKNRDIKKMFLTEAVLIGFLGGLSGLMIGFGLQFIFNSLLNILAKTLGGNVLNLFHTPYWFITLIMTFSTVVGFLTGVWPAIRASRLNPLDALRYK